MNIGLDCHALSEEKQFGAATVAREICKEIIRQEKNEFITLYAKENLEYPLFKQKNVKVRVIKGNLGWTQWRLSLEFLLHKKPDVMLFTAHSISRYAPMKKVVIILDLAFLLMPQYFLKKDLARLTILTSDAIKRADAIMAISEATKKDVIKLFPQIKNINTKIHVIPLGYEAELFFPRDKEEQEKIKHKFNIKKNYILYTGSFQARKDLPTLISSFEKLAPILDLELVLGGGGGWLSEETEKRIRESPQREKIKKLGYIKREEMPALQSGAVAFVLPSLYEGFGLPLIEAMACGTPVIYAKNSSMIEVVKDSGLSFETKSIKDLSSKIKKIYRNHGLRKLLSQKSLNRAKKYSWQKTAAMTLKLLKETAKMI